MLFCKKIKLHRYKYWLFIPTTCITCIGVVRFTVFNIVIIINIYDFSDDAFPRKWEVYPENLNCQYYQNYQYYCQYYQYYQYVFPLSLYVHFLSILSITSKLSILSILSKLSILSLLSLLSKLSILSILR